MVRSLFKSKVQKNKDALFENVKNHTFCSREKLESLCSLAAHLNEKNVMGDFVECGVYKGGSAAVLAKYMGQDRKLWLFDSFKGMPETVPQDGIKAKDYIGEGAVAIDSVYEVLRNVDADLSRIHISEGYFQDTFTKTLPSKVALLHCDADWYESVLLTLETFYPRVQEGGVIILDDFGYWEGCRVAFYDFCKKWEITPLVERVSSDQLFWIKNKSTNRIEGK